MTKTGAKMLGANIARFSLDRVVMCLFAALVLAATTLATVTQTLADNYPSKTITLIVPASPGGIVDVLARVLAQRLTDDFASPVVVENKPGANNLIAAEYVTRQPADGYTLFVAPESTFVMNPSLYKNLRYDPVNGFTPVGFGSGLSHAGSSSVGAGE